MDRDAQIQAARNGDREARDALIEWVYPKLWRFYRGRVAVDEIGDLVNDTIKDLLVKFPTHAPDTADAFLDWASSFAGMTARSRTTKRRRRQANNAKLAVQAPLLAVQKSLDSHMSEQRKRRLVRRYILRLPTIYRNAVLHRLRGGKFESLARREKIAVPTARGRYANGLLKLRRLIENASQASSSQTRA